ncbi:MAG: PTS sugar transporter subunit IIA [Herbinix sp.]|nr:PTS sugar transporter subunit IIA [Herbinix sp.]
MIGIIVTGHGKFATGIETNVKLLVGKDAKITTVDFDENDSVDALESKLTVALEDIKDCEYKILLCDIIGGSPFNKAVMLTSERPDTRVIYGTHVAMVVELCMKNLLEEKVEDIDDLVTEIISIGKEQIGTFIKVDVIDHECEDGI